MSDKAELYGAGYLLGVFVRYGIQAFPVTDESGDYTTDLRIVVPNPDHHYPDITAVVRVQGWETDE